VTTQPHPSHAGLSAEAARLDALKEVANIGTGHAATALSELLRQPVHITVPAVALYDLDRLPMLYRETAQVWHGVALGVTGDLKGNLLLLGEEATVGALERRMAENGIPLGARELLTEIGNILAGSFLTAVGEFTGLTARLGLPRYHSAPVDEFFEPLLEGLTRPADRALVADTVMYDRGGALQMHLVLLLERAGQERLLGALKVKAEPRVEAPAGPRVLVVDDAAFMRLTLSGILTRHGFEVVGEAASAEEAVWLYPDLRPDVVLMDLTMPGMGGVEGVRALRRLDPHAKIIMCSAMGQRDLVLQAIAAGARDFIIKPFNEDRLVGAIKRALELKD